MSIDRRLLVILGRRLPAIYDIIPRGPLSRFSEVALNPQPPGSPIASVSIWSSRSTTSTTGAPPYRRS
jgi:hypothetical protein